MSQTLKGSGVIDGSVNNVAVELSQHQITTVKFNGNNYLSWSKSTPLYIKGKDNEDYLTGKIEILSPGNPKNQKWKNENALVMG